VKSLAKPILPQAASGSELDQKEIKKISRTRMQKNFDQQITQARICRIEKTLELLGSRPSRKEKNKWLCPSHGGSSFHVWPDRNIGKCFGCDITSGRSLDSIGLISAVRNVSFKDAVEILISGTTSDWNKSPVDKLPKARSENSIKKRIEFCPETNSRIYYHLLSIAKNQNQSEGQNYLKERMIPWEIAHDHHKIVWLKDPCSAFGILRENYFDEELEAAGLISKKRRFLFSFPILLVPYFEQDYIRSLEGLIRKQDRGRYLNSSIKSLALSGIKRLAWGLNNLRANTEAVAVEGVIDALSISVLSGEQAVVGVPGSQNHKALVHPKIGKLNQIKIIGDQDEAGYLFSISLRDLLKRFFPRLKVDVRRYPIKFNDANEWLCFMNS